MGFTAVWISYVELDLMQRRNQCSCVDRRVADLSVTDISSLSLLPGQFRRTFLDQRRMEIRTMVCISPSRSLRLTLP